MDNCFVACYQDRIGCPFFLASFFFFFFFCFFALFFPLILRFSSSSSILLRNTKTSLWSRRCKRQKQRPSGSGWYNECVRCDLKVYKKKQEKSRLENWLSCRQNLPLDWVFVREKTTTEERWLFLFLFLFLFLSDTHACRKSPSARRRQSQAKNSPPPSPHQLYHLLVPMVNILISVFAHERNQDSSIGGGSGGEGNWRGVQPPTFVE